MPMNDAGLYAAFKASEYLRTVQLEDGVGLVVCGWVRVTHAAQANALEVTVGETLLPVLPHILARIRRLFDLSCDPAAVYVTLEHMNEIRPGLAEEWRPWRSYATVNLWNSLSRLA